MTVRARDLQAIGIYPASTIPGRSECVVWSQAFFPDSGRHWCKLVSVEYLLHATRSAAGFELLRGHLGRPGIAWPL